MGNGMNKVLPGLYIGNYQDSKDADQLERFEITHILAIHDTARRLHSDKHYLCILAADSPDQNLSQYFSLCNDFIHAARLRGGNVLIHCLAGMSRSVTVAVAYIMSITNLSWKEALKVVKVGRSIANPNVGFQQQLKDFESSRLQDVSDHRAVSRVDLSAAVACSSSNANLSTVGRSSAFSTSNWRLTAGSAPNTPRPTPPVSPQRWPRRFSNRQTPQLPVPPESHPSTMT
ncbi:dual specificity protein phosphatase 22-like [Pogonomyrmex barbatus]|uniref:Dual specificity protein phosphatase 15 n=1 Tax=Pogonomyrmex barbatus TaxID=144034 RepID=A0A6I9WKV0_9HYME|nr:dual specificity protein phosphatase 22-like [Pogonomyrmex barbatus]